MGAKRWQRRTPASKNICYPVYIWWRKARKWVSISISIWPRQFFNSPWSNALEVEFQVTGGPSTLSVTRVWLVPTPLKVRRRKNLYNWTYNFLCVLVIQFETLSLVESSWLRAEISYIMLSELPASSQRTNNSISYTYEMKSIEINNSSHFEYHAINIITYTLFISLTKEM